MRQASLTGPVIPPTILLVILPAGPPRILPAALLVVLPTIRPAGVVAG